MSYTVQYLQSELAAQGLEVSVLVNCLVQDAIRLGASDLHIEPWETAIAVRARVNGVLTEVAHLPLDLMDKISMRFKVMSNLVTYQAGTPQDGTAVGGPELDGVQLRVSIFPTTRGEKIVVRLFDPRDRRFELGTLGFEDSTLQGLLRVLKRTSGLLLFTGPTGSGKTSTMYSSLCYIMQRDGTSVSISTVEDPVEFNLPMVSQTQINPAQEFTYAIALRSIMRQDPQVIMVGEIRDAGDRRHRRAGRPDRPPGPEHHPLRRVGGRLHPAHQHGDRAFHAGVEHSRRDGAAAGALGLPELRPALRAAARASSRSCRKRSSRRPNSAGAPAASSATRPATPAVLPVSELLVVNEPFREAVLKKMPTSALEEIAIQQGMRTLWQNGLTRAITGQTTLEEIIRVLAADMV